MCTNGTSFQHKFNAAYEKAGLQECKVIDTADGFVQVNAAPGISIPTILALRIAKILSGNEIIPENILCFTDGYSSTIALKTQLEQLVGPRASNITIHTFASFSEQVLKENGGLLNTRSLKAISTLESIQLLKKLINAFPATHALKRFRSDVYYEISNLEKLFAYMKSGGWTAEKLIQTINYQVRETTAIEGANNNFQTDSNASKTEAFEKLKAAIAEFDHYQHLLQAAGKYDATDFIYLVIKTLEDNKNVLARYQEKFKYLHVTDSEIINNPSGKLLQLLLGGNKRVNMLTVDYIRESTACPEKNTEKPPIEFTKEMPHQQITLELQHPLNYLPGKELLNKQVITSFQTVMEEMNSISQQVQVLLQQKTAPKKIAVIYPTDEYCASLEVIFTCQKIPFYSNRTTDVLQQPFTKKIIQLMRYISREQEVSFSGDDLLFEILHFDFYTIPPPEIAKLAIEVNSRKYSKTPTAIRKLLVERSNAPAKDLFDTGINKSLKEVSCILEKLIALAPTLSPTQLFENIIQHAQVLQYADQSGDRLWLMQLLTTLSDFINSEATQNPMLSFNELIESIDAMEQASVFSLQISCTTGNENDVQLLKADQAQGREFEYVFIAGANVAPPAKDNWINLIDKFPGTATNNFFNKFDESRHKALHQLFYATLTGNTTQLFVSFAEKDSKGNVLVPALFLAEILSRHSIKVNAVINPATELLKQMTLQQTNRLPEIVHLDEPFITPILKKFVMNVSALNSYLHCPLGFYYKYILRIPAGKNEAMEFGSAIHYALENLFKKMSSGNLTPNEVASQFARQNQFPSAATMVEDFNTYMNNHRTNFTREAFERRMQYGGEVLRNYYNQYSNSWNKVVSIERNIRGITVNGVPLKGKLDKLEFYGKDVIIVDYKSGDIEKALPKMKPPHEGDPNGGDYWRQAVFYKILVDNYAQKDWKVIGTEFDFIEPDSKMAYRKERIVINPPDITTLHQQIAEVWAKIQSRQFYTGCGKQDCHWCNFVKDNKLAVELHNAK